MSARKAELLEAAYRYVLEHGLGDMSLRPLAAAVGSSPRVLLFLFGSKEGLVRELLARSRVDELAVLDRVRDQEAGGDPRAVGAAIWTWLSTPGHKALLTLWLEAYSRSLVEPDGPWAGFAAQTVRDWLAVLDGTGGSDQACSDQACSTLLLAVLRGALIDLLATGDVDRVTAAVLLHLESVTTEV
jgi:AcrR family transcriptional regulator